MLSYFLDLVKFFMAPLRKAKVFFMADKKHVQYVFRSSITINGVTYYAKDYGKKAFKIPVNKLK